MARKKRQRTILLVEEEKSERDYLRAILEPEGYLVVEATNYWDALAVHSQHSGQIDMLLSAIALPGNNGYELASAMIQTDPSLKVLFASGATGAEVSRFYNMPVTGPHLVKKPVERNELLSRVNRVFRTQVRHLHAQRAR